VIDGERRGRDNADFLSLFLAIFTRLFPSFDDKKILVCQSSHLASTPQVFKREAALWIPVVFLSAKLLYGILWFFFFFNL